MDRILSGQGIYESDLSPIRNNENLRNEIRHNLGLDLPLFYFSVSSSNNHVSIKNSPHNSEIFSVPIISIHKENQFHRWLFGNEKNTVGILRGDFGKSWATGQDVCSIISSGIKWSLFFTISSIVLAYLISVPAALKAVRNPGSFFDKSITVITTILFSLPAFWLASLLMLLLCNPGVLNILPSSGIGPVGGFEYEISFFGKIIHSLPYLILPTICYTYGSLAFLIRSIKTSVNQIMKEDYIRTAYAKGLDEKTIIRKHALRNALLPMITIFSQVFPFAIGGSVILETVFTIPGMGFTIYQSIGSHDYPVIIAVFLITGIITMVSFLITDILYAIVDPRITYSNRYYER